MGYIFTDEQLDALDGITTVLTKGQALGVAYYFEDLAIYIDNAYEIILEGAKDDGFGESIKWTEWFARLPEPYMGITRTAYDRVQEELAKYVPGKNEAYYQQLNTRVKAMVNELFEAESRIGSALKSR
jgi:hypothetical protein